MARGLNPALLASVVSDTLRLELFTVPNTLLLKLITETLPIGVQARLGLSQLGRKWLTELS